MGDDMPGPSSALQALVRSVRRQARQPLSLRVERPGVLIADGGALAVRTLLLNALVTDSVFHDRRLSRLARSAGGHSEVFGTLEGLDAERAARGLQPFAEDPQNADLQIMEAA